jgi:1-deoxy-D-xylulose-5-phosphate reductoisomerase
MVQMSQHQDANAPVQRRVALLGSTGSIGTQAIDVITRSPHLFVVDAICAGGADIGALAAQAVALRVNAVGVSREGAAEDLRQAIGALAPKDYAMPEVLSGRLATQEVAARDVDVVLNGVAGAQGLRATLAALDGGAIVALANKESLVAGGPLVLGRAKPGQLVPVDSEHSALAQCLRAGSAGEVSRLILTASGGPFRGRTRQQLREVQPAQALAHPTWAMGPLVTTNSATLVNKGLELIEAHLLFGIPYEQIDVVVHPQSIVHSMVEFTDGATLAQASPPDMRLPIALALGWPHRVPGAAPSLDWATATSWTFEPVDEEAFPAVRLARRAGTAGGCAPAVLNAANEDAVAAFLAGRIGFLGIVDAIEAVVELWLGNEHSAFGNPGTVEHVEEAERWARAQLARLIAVQS